MSAKDKMIERSRLMDEIEKTEKKILNAHSNLYIMYLSSVLMGLRNKLKVLDNEDDKDKQE